MKLHKLDNANIGDGATWTIHTDRHAGTIIRRTNSTIWLQRDNAELLNGPKSDAEDKLQVSVGGFAAHTSGTQRYEYSPNPEGSVTKFTRRVVKANRYHDGFVVWKRVGSNTRSPGNTLNVGRCEHYDYNF